MGWFRSGLQRLPYGFEHAVHVFEDLVVPEPHQTKARAFQTLRATRVGFGSIGVLTAIKLDDEHCFKADKIENVVFEWVLSTEFEAAKLSQTQVLSQGAFGFGRCVAQAKLKFRAKNGWVALPFHQSNV